MSKMTDNTAQFKLGDLVRIGDEIHGTVEEIIFERGRPKPLYLVEWWLNGGVCERRFLEEQLTAAERD